MEMLTLTAHKHASHICEIMKTGGQLLHELRAGRYVFSGWKFARELLSDIFGKSEQSLHGASPVCGCRDSQKLFMPFCIALPLV